MKIIKLKDAKKDSNSEKCKTLEYSFNDSDLDLGIATITGRYPDNGYCVNEISKELIYVLEGSGRIIFQNTVIEFEKGDSILIDSKEMYCWESNYCVISMTCNPSWTKEQHKLIG